MEQPATAHQATLTTLMMPTFLHACFLPSTDFAPVSKCIVTSTASIMAASAATKIKVENPVVDILGDEMTRIIWDVSFTIFCLAVLQVFWPETWLS